MKLHRLRDRLGRAFGLLLAALVVTTVALVGLESYQGYSETLHRNLEDAPERFQDKLRPWYLLFSQQGRQFALDGELRRLRTEERDYRDRPDHAEDYEAAFLTLVDETRYMVEGNDSAQLLMLVNLPNKRTVLELRNPWKEPDLSRPPAELPYLPGLEQALRDLQPRQDYLLLDGELYVVTIVPLRTSVTSESGDLANGVVLLGRRLSEVAAPRDTTMVFTGPGLPPPQVKLQPGMREVDWRGHHYLVQSAPLGETAVVYFLADLATVRQHVAELMLSVAGLGLLALLAGWAMSARLAAAITRPIEQLARLMQKVGRGDLTQRAPVEGRDEVAQLSSAFNQMTQGLQEREAFRKLAPEGARREIERDSAIKLGGDWIEATILFSDLRGFTSMSEKLAPTAVVELLNEYLQDMSVALKEHGGDINEYIGDAILAVFHGPESGIQAVQAALDMQDRLEALRGRTANPVLKSIRMGIGIHTGDLVEGWIGAQDRIKYGVVGDTVNLAARIQDRSRDGKHTFILVSGFTRDKLGDRFELAFFGDETFKGKTGTTPVWEVVGPSERFQAPEVA